MRRGIIAFAVAGLSLGLCITPGITVEVAQAAAGDFTVSPTTVDFGTVAVNVTKTIPVVIKNVSTTTQTPNFSGGAPNDPTNFGGSQNCAGVPLAAGGTCQFSYTFTPTSVGAKTSSTTIGIDSQTFAITFLGCGGTSANCATTTTSTTTTTKPTTTTTKPTNPTQPAGTQPAGASTTTVVRLGAPQATVATPEVAAGHTQTAIGRGFQPGEVVSATQQPDKLDLGSQTAAADGVVQFSWTIPKSEQPGPYLFVATGAKSGPVSAPFTITAATKSTDSDSDMSPWVITLIAAIAVLVLAGLVYLAYRRGRGTTGRTATAASGDSEASSDDESAT